ncbi:uncharacterized protein LOC114333306 [Diabrotica virgifera virgifera]|uniref:Uncharacterized protein n=1 Tax=Diabrotica virgifera virgifera TaxID=50390 RepID=A0ABM5IQN6_DIAVI|nr:uncharacterized protein LOC114333306 [Diabrotica virgifera virgifera]
MASNLEELFRKSKKVFRSPNKTPNEDNKLDQIIKMMHDLTKETKNLTTEVKEIKNEQRKYWEELNDLKTELEKVKQENQTKHKEKEEMKKELNDMKIRVQRLEKERKVNNVVIQGLTIDTIDRNALKQAVGNFMEKEMNINVQIEEAIKLGEKTCLVKLQNKFEKEKIMQNKAKLKHIKDYKVYINNDITKEELQTQKSIRQVANEEISKDLDSLYKN